ncbi:MULTISPECIES: phosphatase PAP2 family protein [Cysteiniphilum]|uniref:undecaprenyl-diphosphate phosphatase n=1 Tax=Cysteiniphilum litorale TaxID=2056700 RepID=A0A8J2Z3L1_9GAMM|nr:MULTISPECIES: phosphatase PAP2 family protein [Cysteiniphilum]GGF94952.1 phosphatase PAP2 family protein [Cysteiniphilum litorale]
MTNNFKKLIKITLIYGIVTLIICAISYIYFDRLLVTSISEQLQHNILIKLSNILSFIFDPNNWFVLFIILVIICIWQKTRDKLNPRLLAWTMSLFISIAAATVLKLTLARYRPELFLQEGLYGFHWLSHKRLFNSFPSGHATLGFAGLLGLAYLVQNKKFTVLCIIIALIITISRILSSEHYLSDVLAGVYIGVFSYLWAKALCYRKSS